MLDKIRHSMGKRDDYYTLCNEGESDEGFFEIVPNKRDHDWIVIELKDNDGKYKPGKGSQKQATVLVMAESKTFEPIGKYKHKPTKKMGYIKMQLLDDFCKETTNEQIEKTLDLESSVARDGANNYNDLQDKLTDHKAVVIEPKKDTLKILP